jgi:hypothetical protein
LLYIARHTRPDILTAVNTATRFCSNPSGEHVKLVNQIYEYLNGSSKLKMRMYPNQERSELKITAYVDANWGSKEAGSRSRSGYAIYINQNLVIYACKTQHCIAMSTMEAEYIALSEVVKEIGWLTQLLDELGMEYEVPDVRVDNQAAISYAQGMSDYSKAKHIHLRYNFVREAIARGEIEVSYVKSADNIADIFTKGLDRNSFSKQRRGLNLV